MENLKELNEDLKSVKETNNQLFLCFIKLLKHLSEIDWEESEYLSTVPLY